MTITSDQLRRDLQAQLNGMISKCKLIKALDTTMENKIGMRSKTELVEMAMITGDTIPNSLLLVEVTTTNGGNTDNNNHLKLFHMLNQVALEGMVTTTGEEANQLLVVEITTNGGNTESNRLFLKSELFLEAQPTQTTIEANSSAEVIMITHGDNQELRLHKICTSTEVAL